MPRDANGNYTLPSGNPVITGTTIESAWANTTMDDIKQSLTDSLDRYGRGGMLAPFRFVDGTVSQPGMSWASELSTGFYRAGANDQRATVNGIARMRWTNVGVDVWDTVSGTWLPLTTASGSNFALLNASNKFTQDQTIVKASPAWALWKDATPTLGARFAFNIAAADSMELSHFNGSSWVPVFRSNVSYSFYNGNEHIFSLGDGTTKLTQFTAAGMELFNARTVRFYSSDNGLSSTINQNGGVLDFASTEAFRFGIGAAHIASIVAGGINFLEGKAANFYGPASNGLTSLNEGGGTNGFIINQQSGQPINFLIGGNKRLSVENGSIGITVGVGGAVANDLYINRTGSGANVVGQNSWIQLFNTTDGRGGGIQVNQFGGLLFWTFNGSGWSTSANVDTNGINITDGKQLALTNAANTAWTLLRHLADNGGANQLRIAERGAAWHWNDSLNIAGDISTSTTDPAASGGRYGQIVLVYE